MAGLPEAQVSPLPEKLHTRFSRPASINRMTPALMNAPHRGSSVSGANATDRALRMPTRLDQSTRPSFALSA